MFFICLPESENDSMVDAHSGIRVRPKTRENDKLKQGLFLSKTIAQARRPFFCRTTIFGILEVSIECVAYKMINF